MEYVKLGDIAKIVAGSTAPKENQFNDNIGLPFIRAGHLEDLCNNYDLKKLPKIDENNKNIKKQVKVPKNTIVFAKSGMSCMKSRVYQTTEECYIVNHLAGVICSENVNPSYLKYYFMVNKPNRLIVDESYPSIRLSDISNMDIYLPNLDTQQKIAEVLDKAQVLIDKRKEQIEALDELVKSRFIEMFGELKTNENNFEIVDLEELTTKITDGVHSKPEYTSEGIPFISVKDINKGKLNFSECKYISKEAHEKYIKRCHPEVGDILYTKVGATYGIPAIVDIYKEFSLYVSVALLKLKKDYVNPVYMKEALRSIDIKRQADRKVKGIGVPDLHLVEIKKFKIFNPPIELQNQFADFANQVDKLKSQMETSLKELEDNFNSLMQKAFKGELF